LGEGVLGPFDEAGVVKDDWVPTEEANDPTRGDEVSEAKDWGCGKLCTPGSLFSNC